MKAQPFEVVYINGGEIYKAPDQKTIAMQYVPDAQADKEFPYRKHDGKRYFCTTHGKRHFSGSEGVDLTGCDLCPAVTLWLAMGARTPDERRNLDLYFAMDSAQQLHEVAAYYRLPVPADRATLARIEAEPERYAFRHINGQPVVVAGIKFIDGKPGLFKLYTYPKEPGGWEVWMYGAAWYNGGRCWEAGAVHTKETGGNVVPGAQMRMHDAEVKASLIDSVREDGVVTHYEFLRGGDPVLFWRGVEVNALGEAVRIKHYESSDFARRVVAGMTNGTRLERFDLCPAVKCWLGRAWYDDADEHELLFAVTGGSAQLDRVAAYYKLPVPYDAEKKSVLDTQPELYRARHYDLYGLGEGHYVPVIVASITFAQGRPARLLLYTFMRQWEFDEQIVFPMLAASNCLAAHTIVTC